MKYCQIDVTNVIMIVVVVIIIITIMIIIIIIIVIIIPAKDTKSISNYIVIEIPTSFTCFFHHGFSMVFKSITLIYKKE